MDCNFATTNEIDRGRIESWLVLRQAEGMAARTRNSYVQALSSFCNWCVETGRLAVNPVAKINKADEAVDRRRHRRALTEAELMKLLDVARRRPLADYGRRTLPKPIDQRKGKRDTWIAEQLTAETFDAAVARATQRLEPQSRASRSARPTRT